MLFFKSMLRMFELQFLWNKIRKEFGVLNHCATFKDTIISYLGVFLFSDLKTNQILLL